MLYTTFIKLFGYVTCLCDIIYKPCVVCYSKGCIRYIIAYTIFLYNLFYSYVIYHELSGYMVKGYTLQTPHVMSIVKFVCDIKCMSCNTSQPSRTSVLAASASWALWVWTWSLSIGACNAAAAVEMNSDCSAAFVEQGGLVKFYYYSCVLISGREMSSGRRRTSINDSPLTSWHASWCNSFHNTSCSKSLSTSSPAQWLLTCLCNSLFAKSTSFTSRKTDLHMVQVGKVPQILCYDHVQPCTMTASSASCNWWTDPLCCFCISTQNQQSGECIQLQYMQYIDLCIFCI